MVVSRYDERRIICRTSSGKWNVGMADTPVLLKHHKFFDDLSTGIRSPDQCILRALMGLDTDQVLYTPTNPPTYDEAARRAIQEAKISIKKEIKDITQNIKDAKKACEYDLVESYRKDLADQKKNKSDLEDATKVDLISPKKSRPLDDGDPFKEVTKCIRERKRRALKAMKDAGLSDEADDLDRCFDVPTRSVIFHSSDSDYIWIVATEHAANHPHNNVNTNVP